MATIFRKLKTRIKGFLRKIEFLRKIYNIYRYSFVPIFIPYSKKRKIQAGIIADYLKNILSNKTICDLGAGPGFQMIEFKKYADNVLGIEIKENYWKKCIKKGLNVRLGDFLKGEIPTADIYYAWLPQWVLKIVYEKLKDRKCIFIMRNDSEKPTIKKSRIINLKEGVQLQIINFKNFK